MTDLISGTQTDKQLQPVEVVSLLAAVFSFHVCTCAFKKMAQNLLGCLSVT